MCCKSKDWLSQKFPKGHWKKVTKKREEKQSRVINQYTQGVGFCFSWSLSFEKRQHCDTRLKREGFHYSPSFI